MYFILHALLHLKHISLIQFKNYEQATFSFTKKVTGICGNNGLGKTNLLDAIYYLCFTKSYFNKADNASVMQGKQGLRLEGIFDKNEETEKIVCILRENNRKEVLHNGEMYKKFSEHIGQFPVVIIAPDDVELVTGLSEVRRRFVDTLISQLDPDYLQQLIMYNKILAQRNSLLKSFAEKNIIDENLLDILDKQLSTPGKFIYENRNAFLKKFLPFVQQQYQQIAGNNEPLELLYYSPLAEDDFGKLLKTYRPKDLLLQRSTIGIHKDDIEINLAGGKFKSIASQGQRKSLLFALKLSEFEELKKAKSFPPILLLDDVFEKLDENRMDNLLQRVCLENEGQVFITDTHKERLEKTLENLGVDFDLVYLE